MLLLLLLFSLSVSPFLSPPLPPAPFFRRVLSVPILFYLRRGVEFYGRGAGDGGKVQVVSVLRGNGGAQAWE